ncbi:multisubstrate pseudouridine synthase 7 [Coniothyrium glycines]
MSDRVEESARPAKRARLDDDNAPVGTSEPIAVTVQATPTTLQSAIDSDLEREIRAGITEYVCPNNLGFKGVLKQRYTDFLVNEVGLDGKVVHLTSTEVDRRETPAQNGSGNNIGTNGHKHGPRQTLELGDNDMAGTPAGLQETDLQLTSTEAKQEPEQGDKTENVAEKEAEEAPEDQLSADDTSILESIFGHETTTQIVTLVRQVRRREHKKAKDFKAVISPPITDKEQRTQAHKTLRRLFPNLLESSMEEDQSLRIKATPPAERQGKKKGKGSGRDVAGNDSRSNRGQMRWEELGGDYLHFTLYKENKDTMEVVGFLGSKLNCGTKGFGFAGTKDRRACTAQRVCVKRQTAERMHGFNKVLFNAAIGDYEYRANDLKLGDLKGNEFTITLRNCQFEGQEDASIAQRVTLADEIVGKAIQDFSEKGFINYYGLQRFGSFAASTDSIGRKMLQDDLKGAVEDLLAYSETALAAAENGTDSSILVSQDDRNRAKALHIWRTEAKGNAALDILPRKFTAERNIIQHLSSRNSKNGRHDRRTDWQGALMTIPRTLRLMYVHAYQSLVWNVVAGKRWTSHGDRVIEGDLVLVNEHRDKEISILNEEREGIDQNGEEVINPTGSENANAADRDFERARALTATEADSGMYTIWDVVLPQPGFDVEYPKNAIGQFYKEFMGSEQGGGLDPYNMRRQWREVSLSGGYRKFLARPLETLEFETHAYTKEDEQFVKTDLQRLQEAKEGVKEQGEAEGNAAQADKDTEMEDGEEQGEVAHKIAVVLKLQLASSQYATIALRELMKAGGVKAYKPEFMGGR